MHSDFSRFAAFLTCTALGVAQPVLSAAAQIAIAVKSPDALAHYLDARRSVDWKAIRSALGVKESKYWLAPCGSDFPAAESQCSVENAAVLNPDQAILIVRGGQFSYTVEYLRYIHEPGDGWKFAGENSAFQKDSPSHHKIMRVWNKPFLLISSDHSQTGMATGQILEEWFDLTQQDFEPVFSMTADGHEGRFGFGVGRTIHAMPIFSEAANVEKIQLTLDVEFNGVGLNQPADYVGVYERRGKEKKFALRNAYVSLLPRTPMPTVDFEELADPFSGISNEKLLAYALPGLQKIATGSDSEAKEWLRSILENAMDTPEKRQLLALLTKH